ncbi:hypothetical protein ACLMJK_004952 [Lecanora helva]
MPAVVSVLRKVYVLAKQLWILLTRHKQKRKKSEENVTISPMDRDMYTIDAAWHRQHSVPLLHKSLHARQIDLYTRDTGTQRMRKVQKEEAMSMLVTNAHHFEISTTQDGIEKAISALSAPPTLIPACARHSDETDDEEADARLDEVIQYLSDKLWGGETVNQVRCIFAQTKSDVAPPTAINPLSRPESATNRFVRALSSMKIGARVTITSIGCDGLSSLHASWRNLYHKSHNLDITYVVSECQGRLPHVRVLAWHRISGTRWMGVFDLKTLVPQIDGRINEEYYKKLLLSWTDANEHRMMLREAYDVVGHYNSNKRHAE